MKNYSTLNSKSMIFFSVVLLTLVSFGENSCLSMMRGSSSNFVKNFLGNEEMNLSHLSPIYYGSINISNVHLSQRTSLSLFNPLTLKEADNRGIFQRGLGKSVLMEHISSARGSGNDQVSDFVIGNIFWALIEGDFLAYNKDNVREGSPGSISNLSQLQPDGSAVIPGIKTDYYRAFDKWLGTPDRSWVELNRLYMSAHEDPGVKNLFREYKEADSRYYGTSADKARNKILWEQTRAAYERYSEALKQTRRQLLGKNLAAFEATPTPFSPEMASRTLVDGTSSYSGNGKLTPLRDSWEQEPVRIKKEDVDLRPLLYKTFSQVNYQVKNAIVKDLLKNPDVFYAFYIKEFGLSSNNGLNRRAEEIINTQDSSSKYAYRLLCHFFNSILSMEKIPERHLNTAAGIVRDFASIQNAKEDFNREADFSFKPEIVIY
jgi:hypothetical protein